MASEMNSRYWLAAAPIRRLSINTCSVQSGIRKPGTLFLRSQFRCEVFASISCSSDLCYAVLRATTTLDGDGAECGPVSAKRWIPAILFLPVITVLVAAVPIYPGRDTEAGPRQERDYFTTDNCNQ